MNKVGFLIVGTQKGGTTALDSYLRQHPQIAMGIKKELHFFDNDVYFKKSIDYSQYENCFENKQTAIIKGEATPIYMYWNPCMQRIYDYNKHIKLIVIIRSPIDRAFSHWNMELNRNNETKDFLYCIKNEKLRLNSSSDKTKRIVSYVDRGLYVSQIQRIYSYFDAKQVFIIKYEDFINNQQEKLQEILSFLNLEPFIFTLQKVFETNYHNRVIINEAKEYLSNIFYPEIKELEKLLAWDCSDWL